MPAVNTLYSSMLRRGIKQRIPSDNRRGARQAVTPCVRPLQRLRERRRQPTAAARARGMAVSFSRLETPGGADRQRRSLLRKAACVS